jgi:hypothetical protein
LFPCNFPVSLPDFFFSRIHQLLSETSPTNRKRLDSHLREAIQSLDSVNLVALISSTPNHAALTDFTKPPLPPLISPTLPIFLIPVVSSIGTFVHRNANSIISELVDIQHRFTMKTAVAAAFALAGAAVVAADDFPPNFPACGVSNEQSLMSYQSHPVLSQPQSWC